MSASPKAEIRRANGEAEKLRAETLKTENQCTSPFPSPQSGEGGPALFLTRHELAGALQISVSLVDLMVRGGEMTCLRVRGNFVRFYLPHVIRDLAAASAVRSRITCGK